MSSRKRSGWDHYKTPRGTSLSPSRTTPGAYRGLIHGAKGIDGQAELFKVSGRRVLLGKVVRTGLAAVFAVAAVGAVLVVLSVMLSAVVEGAASGLESVSRAAERATRIVTIGAIITIPLLVVLTIRRRAQRRHSRAQVLHARRSPHQVVDIPSATPSRPRTHLNQALDYEHARAQHAPAADWYPDPLNQANWRYWDGSIWTEHTHPQHHTQATPPVWHHSAIPVTADPWPRPSNVPGVTARSVESAEQPVLRRSHEAECQRQPVIPMTTEEWQRTVLAWIAAGAVEQELWNRLTHARISDASPLTLEMQHQMERLTAEQGASRARRMLETNPQIRLDANATSLLLHLLGIHHRGDLIEIDRRHDGGSSWMV